MWCGKIIKHLCFPSINSSFRFQAIFLSLLKVPNFYLYPEERASLEDIISSYIFILGVSRLCHSVHSTNQTISHWKLYNIPSRPRTACKNEASIRILTTAVRYFFGNFGIQAHDWIQHHGWLQQPSRVVTVPAFTSSPPSAGLLLGGVSREEEFTERRIGIVSSSAFYKKHWWVSTDAGKTQKTFELGFK